MKYVVSWTERSQGSATGYENAQKRILSNFQHWQMPAALKVQNFFVRVGDMGGYMVIETDDAQALITLTAAFSAFAFKVDTVIDIGEAVPAELEAIAWRDSLASPPRRPVANGHSEMPQHPIETKAKGLERSGPSELSCRGSF